MKKEDILLKIVDELKKRLIEELKNFSGLFVLEITEEYEDFEISLILEKT